MDLKDVIANVCSMAGEAHSSFHAGHPETSKKFLNQIKQVCEEHCILETIKESDVTESATNEKPAESLEETQAKVSKPGVHPAVIDPAAAAETTPGHLGDGKLTQ